jgi:hypothetical protein
MSPTRSENTVDEETPLLHSGHPPTRETPLPAVQILVLLLLQLAEPITSLSINPYINQVRFSAQIVGVGALTFSQACE